MYMYMVFIYDVHLRVGNKSMLNGLCCSMEMILSLSLSLNNKNNVKYNILIITIIAFFNKLVNCIVTKSCH